MGHTQLSGSFSKGVLGFTPLSVIAVCQVICVATHNTSIFCSTGNLLFLFCHVAGRCLRSGATFLPVIVGIGQRRFVAENLSIHYFTDEDGMITDINFIKNPRFKIRDDVIGNNWSSGLTCPVMDAFKLISVPARFKTELPDKRKGRILAENGHGKYLTPFDELIADVTLGNANGNGRRLRGYLLFEILR